MRRFPPRALQHDARAAYAPLLEAFLPWRARPWRMLDGPHAGAPRSLHKGPRTDDAPSRVRDVHAVPRRHTYGLAVTHDIPEKHPSHEAVHAPDHGAAAAARRVPLHPLLAHARRRGGRLPRHRAVRRPDLPQDQGAIPKGQPASGAVRRLTTK